MKKGFKVEISKRPCSGFENFTGSGERNGILLALNSISTSYQQGCAEWNFVVLAIERKLGAALPKLTHELQSLHGVEGINLPHARN